MAVTNGARKASTSGTSHGRTHSSSGRISLTDRSILDEFFKAGDRKPTKITIKRKALTEQSVPGNWQESKSSRPKPKIPTASSKHAEGPVASRLVNPIEPRIAATFPSGKPFEECGEMIQCKHCKKPVYKSAAPEHIRDCLRKKQEKLQKKKEAREAKDAALRKERNGGVLPDASGDGEGNRGSGDRNAGLDPDGFVGSKKSGKKRKAEDDGKGGSTTKKKKKKDEPKVKTAKPKGPVDVEKQCGVILPNGSMCARSLTCKSHSMGAKRAVPGRSMPYDVLLAQYQKKNQAKLQRAAMDANAPLADDFEPQGSIDTDEERDNIMKSINAYYRQDLFHGCRTMGSPLINYHAVPLRRRYNFIRLKGAIKQAIGGVHGAKLFATPATMSSGIFGPANEATSATSAAGVTSATLETVDASRRLSAAAQKASHVGSRKSSISAVG